MISVQERAEVLCVQLALTFGCIFTPRVVPIVGNARCIQLFPSRALTVSMRVGIETVSSDGITTHVLQRLEVWDYQNPGHVTFLPFLGMLETSPVAINTLEPCEAPSEDAPRVYVTLYLNPLPAPDLPATSLWTKLTREDPDE